jgi:hypothetical protein
VLCPLLQALDIVIQLGSIAIPPPGKAIQGGMIAAIRTAKAYKYAYEAQDAAQEWANMIFGGISLSQDAGCGAPPFSIAKLVAKFLDFADVPDNTVPGGIDYQALPCPKGGCRGTRQGERRDDDKKTKTEAPTKSTAPPTTLSSSPILSSSSFTPSATAKVDCNLISKGSQNSVSVRRNILENRMHRQRIEKRGKTGIACLDQEPEWSISSFNFPSSGDEGFVGWPMELLSEYAN